MTKMDEKTLAALKGSIEKWEKIVAGTGADERWKNCPLCLMFNDEDDGDDDFVECGGCPVRERTGEENCELSPYVAWAEAMPSADEPWVADTPERKRLAQAELDFLKSLLPQ